MNSNTNTKNCDHKYECGCDRQYCAVCVEQHIEEAMDDDEKKRNSYLCEDESCRHYYAHRNDNCDCDGRDCGFCNPIEVHNHCSQCDCELTDLTGCYAAEDELLCPHCFETVGKCYECGGEIDLAFQEKLEKANMLDGRGEVCCEKCWKEEWKQSGTCPCCFENIDGDGNTMDDDEVWCDECYENETDECEECGELFRLGTFNTVDEADGTQFCFCDGCRDKMIDNNIIVATDEETIYERVLRKCEQCDCEDKEQLAEYWWNETAGKKWTLCEDCGIAEEQEKC